MRALLGATALCLMMMSEAHAQGVVATIAPSTAQNGVSALAVNPVTNTTYVVNSGAASVTVIDGRTTATSIVSVGSSPSGIAVNPVTNKIYVTNSQDTVVSVIDGATNTPTTIYPVTNKIYVANSGSANVTVIDGATNATSTVAVGTNPSAIAINVVTNTIYVTNSGSNSVTAIDGVTGVPKAIAVGAQPSGIAVNPVTNHIYVANSGDQSVSVIDGATATSIATVAVGNNPNAIDVNPNTNTIYVANGGSNYVSYINGATNTYGGDFAAAGGSFAVAVDPVSNHIYALSNTAAITDFDAGRAASWNVPVTITPVALAVDPASHRVFIAGKNYPQILIMDGPSHGLRETDIGAGNAPTQMAVNAVTGQVYAALSSTNLAAAVLEQKISPVPVSVSIIPISGNATATPTPTFVVSTAGTPPVLTPRAAYLQADSWQGAWTVATNTGSGQFNTSALVLRPGFHTIYAYATDDENASNIASYNLLVLQSNSPFSALSLQALSFRSVLVAATAIAQSVTLSNGGGAPLTVSDQSLSGPNAGDFSTTSTCPASLPVAGSCEISVTFTPTASGPRSASLVIDSNSAGGPQSIALSGAGIVVSFAAAAGSSTSQSVKAGQTADFDLQLLSAGALSVTDTVGATITCSGAPANATCFAPTDPVVATAEKPGSFQISVSTTAAAQAASFGSGLTSTLMWQLQLGVGMLAFSSLAVIQRVKAYRVQWLPSVALLVAALLVGCGGHGTGTGTGTGGGNGGGTSPPVLGGTAPGTYTLTVSAMVSGVPTTTQLTLIVQ